MNVKKTINWRYLSEILTGSSDKLRGDYVPVKNKKKYNIIEEILDSIKKILKKHGYE